jgi:hypothetical protein
VGDVVLALLPRGTYVLHRVRRSGRGWVQTQGDANADADTAVPTSSVVAIAEAIVVRGGERPIPAALRLRTRRLVTDAVRGRLPVTRASCAIPDVGRGREVGA